MYFKEEKFRTSVQYGKSRVKRVDFSSEQGKNRRNTFVFRGFLTQFSGKYAVYTAFIRAEHRFFKLQKKLPNSPLQPTHYL